MDRVCNLLFLSAWQTAASQAAAASLQMKEPNCCQVKFETFIATFTLETAPVYKLVLRLQPLPELPDRWTMDELQVTPNRITPFCVCKRVLMAIGAVF